MAVVLSGVVFLLVLSANLLFGEQLAELPLVLRVAILSIVQVLLLTYVVMPRVTALLKRWLYGLPK
jgi:antibiotic biosynthesis monooxygenase (ABM) superfamily enzyme